MTKRSMELVVDIIDSEDTLTIYKSVKIEIEVTKPNKFGIFKIITKIGDEAPTERYANVNDEKIVKVS